jgi:hypothetical protein
MLLAIALVTAITGPAWAQLTFWGDNSLGQAKPPAGLVSAKQVSSGYGFVVALKADGTVVAWGSPAQHKTNVPRGLKDVIQVAAGKQHALALKKDGTVVAWGGNDYGQATVPTGLTGVIGISAGDKHSLAVKSDGMVVAWGDNSYHQCDVPLTLTGVTQVSAGTGFSVALKSDGTVVCWGDNTFHELEPPAGLNDAIQVSAGKYFALALRNTGTVVAWGTNDKGQCTVPSSVVNASNVSAGNKFGVAVVNGNFVTAWGDPRLRPAEINYQLGRPSLVSAGTDSCWAIEVPILQRISDLREYYGGGLAQPKIRVSVQTALPDTFLHVSASDPALLPTPFDIRLDPDGLFQTVVFPHSPVPVSKTVAAIFTLDGAEPQTISYILRPMTPTISIAGTSIEGGSMIQVTVGLNTKTSAPREIQLESDQPEILKLPNVATVPAGQKDVIVSIPTSVVAVTTPIRITAKFNGGSASATTSLVPGITLKSFEVTPEAYSGTSVSYTVILSAPAPSGGSGIVISGDGVTLPETAVTIPRGNSVAKGMIVVPDVTTRMEGNIVAQHLGSKISKPFVIKPNNFTFVLSVYTVKAGSTKIVSATVTATSFLKDAIEITSSDPLVASVPAKIYVDGTSTAKFRIRHYSVTEKKTVTISANYRGIVHTVNLTLTP